MKHKNQTYLTFHVGKALHFFSNTCFLSLFNSKLFAQELLLVFENCNNKTEQLFLLFLGTFQLL